MFRQIEFDVGNLRGGIDVEEGLGAEVGSRGGAVGVRVSARRDLSAGRDGQQRRYRGVDQQE